MHVIKHLTFINFLLICLNPLFSQTDAIRLNQVGFYPHGPKQAIAVETSSNTFYIASPDLQDTVFTGSLGAAELWGYSAENVKPADFSIFETIGTWRLVVPDLGVSNHFDIKPRVHQEVARASIKAFYFQRMSIDLAEQFAGKWQRPLGHPDTEVLVHASAASTERPEGTIISCPKGWYDAGDYNKYIVNSGISTYTLLATYEHFPEYCRGLDANIPESGDAIPDILDESLWNIRWMLTMQDPNDGGVYHKCTHANFSGSVMPNEATAPRYVIQKSSTATLDFAAVMAQTSRIFREFETEFPGFSDTCLTAALNAWKWARQHPDTYYDQNANNEVFSPTISTGAYGDSDDNDEFRWASAELYITTGVDSFITAIDPLAVNTFDVPGWRNVGTLGIYSLLHYRNQLTAAVDTSTLKNRFTTFADAVREKANVSAYRVMLDTFPWGSNGVAANQSMAMLQAFELTADSSYLDAALDNLDYMLGRNATTYCFVSGQGNHSPMHFHHRPSEADGIVEPVPGLIAGGPNPGQQDGCAGYPSDLPARSYLDAECSYASNEICINWNAPLAFVATGIEALYAPTSGPNAMSVVVLSPENGARYSTVDAIPLTADATIEQGDIIRVEFYSDYQKIGESDTAPYDFDWIGAEPGVHQLTAKAIGTDGEFVTSEPITVIVFNAEAIGDVLFIVGSSDLATGDAAVQSFLIQNDYHVSIQEDDDEAPFDLTDKDVVLVSSTVFSTRKSRNELSNCPVPLVSWKMSLFDDFGWTGKRRTEDYDTQAGKTITILSDGHPIAAGLSGTVDITAEPGDLTWGLPNENANIIALLDEDPTHAAIFTYNREDIMYNGAIANARQVGFYFTDDTPTDMTDDSWKIFQQSILWAIANESLVESDSYPELPTTAVLCRNYPNPFNPSTQIQYVLSSTADVKLSVYNSRGQYVTTLVDGNQTAGDYQIIWNGTDDKGQQVSNGIYFYKMTAGRYQQVHKMILMK